MAKHTTIEIDAAQYEDCEDCLSAAAEEYADEHPECRGYDMAPRWRDDGRDVILIDVPAAR